MTRCRPACTRSTSPEPSCASWSHREPTCPPASLTPRSPVEPIRAMIETNGGFVLVHVATSIDVCEQRDRKGLYAKARAGLVKEFTGVSDPYEEPADAEIVIDSAGLGPEECADSIVAYLER